jgi:hypothetical protein
MYNYRSIGDELHSANELEALKERDWGEVLSLRDGRNGEGREDAVLFDSTSKILLQEQSVFPFKYYLHVLFLVIESFSSLCQG